MFRWFAQNPANNVSATSFDAFVQQMFGWLANYGTKISMVKLTLLVDLKISTWIGCDFTGYPTHNHPLYNTALKLKKTRNWVPEGIHKDC